MLCSALYLLALTSAISDPLSTALESYKHVENYKVTLRSKSAESSEVIRYYYKRPGFVRMEFMTPHKGAVIVYNPLKKEARLSPFPYLKSFVLTLSPDSSLIRSPKGHRVDRSDIGILLKTAKELQDKGTVEILGDDNNVGARPTTLIKVEGKGDAAVQGIHRYMLWLDKKSLLPVKAESYDKKGNLIEELLIDDIEINIDIPEELFSL